MPIDDLVTQLQNLCYTGNLWRESNIKSLTKQTINKNAICGKTNAIMNTYFANPNEKEIQVLGEQLLERYTYADEYLLKIQSAINTAIEMNRATIRNEHIMVQRVVESRANPERNNLQNKRNKERELALLKRMNTLPMDVVRIIKEYMSPVILLSAIVIPYSILPSNADNTDALVPQLDVVAKCNIESHLMTVKLQNVKIVYAYLKKNIYIVLRDMYDLTSRDIIRREDYYILYSGVVGSTKKHFISRIQEICRCYHIILNTISKVPYQPPETRTQKTTLCIKFSEYLTKELTYIYKLMYFVAKPQINRRSKPKPREKKMPNVVASL